MYQCNLHCAPGHIFLKTSLRRCCWYRMRSPVGPESLASSHRRISWPLCPLAGEGMNIQRQRCQQQDIYQGLTIQYICR